MTTPPTTPTEPGWVPCYATDIASGDLIEIKGTHYRVEQRTYTPVYSPVFRVTLPDGSGLTLAKSAQIRIFDPDGSVRSRVHAFPPARPNAGEVDT